ncbi:hypothetical protein GCM10011584_33300 [Nocardioides phosphati]|uniref:Secreted protein n=1 Tax=Nocardioides phosphati TaxID=1867775 RepID=A0ABQ2NF71_9ACTN|nr:hypothetical protein [Nocardioides phosphati]GGO93789.1 hypothetical protein GCM10011584_33300 [Nocardioides phosphati]
MILKLKLALFACLAALLVAQVSTSTTAASRPAPEDHGTTANLKLVSCGAYEAAGYATPGYWSKTWHGSCGHTTSVVKYPKIYVAWTVPPWSSGSICVKARGYRWSDGAAYWTSLGCGPSGGGYVHWGKVGHQVMSTTAVKGWSQMVPLGAPFYFTD